jgi:hypothetical protein
MRWGVVCEKEHKVGVEGYDLIESLWFFFRKRKNSGRKICRLKELCVLLPPKTQTD